MFNNRPPCPDPDRYIWVNSSEGGYWRKKRGSVKKAKLNPVLEQNARLTKTTNSGGSQILGKLLPHMVNLSQGRLYSKLSGRLKKGLTIKGRTDYLFLKGLELQPKYPMTRLLKVLQVTKETEALVEVRVPIFEGTLENTGGLVTHYYFELILLQGDAHAAQDLRIESEMSPVYALRQTAEDCVLTVQPSKKPWMVVFKLNTIETPTPNVLEMAVAPCNYGMQVIAVG